MSGLPKPMKQAELLQHARCGSCNRLLGQCGPLPLFYVVTVERHGLNAPAIQRQSGLEKFLGSPGLASVMGPNEDMTVPLSTTRVMVCERCALHTVVAQVSQLSTPQGDNQQVSE